MKNGLGYLIKLIVSILLIMYTETYFWRLMNALDINLSNINSNIISLVIYIILFALIFLVYRAEIKSAFNKFDNKIGTNLLYTLVAFIIIFASMMLTNYIVKVLANAFSVNYLDLSFTNIFNKPFNIDLIVIFLKDIIIIPAIKVIVFVLGVNNLFEGKTGIFFSGLLYAIYKAYIIKGPFIFLLINVIPYFILFILLSYVYKKNSNIAFSIITYIFYELFASLLIGKLM
jgi:hypothetical protein